MDWNKRLSVRILYGCFFAGVFAQAQVKSKMSFLEIEDGLVNTWVSCIAQDDKGFIWIGTQDGLYRYDGYRSEVLRNSPEDPQSPAANWIRDIFIDAKNNFWLATYGGGVTKFYPRKMDFINFSKGGSNGFQGKLVSHIAPAGKNHVVSSWEEGYAIFNVKTNTHTKLGVEAFKSALTSKDETLWLAGPNNTLLSYDIETRALKQVYTFEAPIYLLKYIPEIGLLVSLPNKLILLKEGTVVNEIPTDDAFTLITNDQSGTCYMATATSIVKLDLDHFRIEPITTDLNLPELEVKALFLDRQESLWVGTDKGLFKETKYNSAFLQNKIPIHARRIVKHDGMLYVGGNQGLFKVEQNQITRLAGADRVIGLASEAGQLLASTDDATVYSFIDDSLTSTIPISTKRGQHLIVRALTRDQSARLWVGSWEGLYVFDKNDRLPKFISLTTESGKGEVKITNLHIDGEDNLWITSTVDGIFKIENASEIDLRSIPDQIETFRKIEGNNTSLTSNIILTLEEDDEGQMWFGTDTGVVKYERKTDNFLRLRYQGELFDKKIMTIRKDAAKNLWITTINDGLYVYNQVNRTIRHYTEKDGLISNAFLFGSGFFDSKNEMMYFGTDEGVQQIDLSRPFAENQMNTPVVTDFEVNTAKGDAVFSPCVAPFLNSVSLAPDQNDFSVSFSALDFTNPEKIQYAYALDDQAFKVTDLQTAYFTNVPFGSHVLKVQTLYDGVIQNRGISNLDIYIAPPWYLSRFAKFLYFLLLCAIVMGIYFYFKWRWSMRLSLKLKEEETERLKKLNDFRSNLYTDIAHEFKTPLTLISGPIDHKLSNGDLSDFDRTNFTMVKRNANRLTSLVDQLLELAKLENGKINLKITKGNLSLFAHTITKSFKFQALQKNIAFSVEIEPLGEVWYDEDVIEKITTNLLSNAFKHAPKNGICEFQVKKKEGQVCINVANTIASGSRIETEKMFTRFYQHDTFSEGVGVGLSLVKELVKVYNGTIDATIEEDDLIRFRVELPIERTAFPEQEIIEPSVQSETVQESPGTSKTDDDSANDNKEELPIMLIVEDHEEIRTFIKRALQKKYRILEAENGKIGMELALREIPDIILSDVRMPVRGGIELCNALKTDERTGHIPIILLTASIGEDDELNGLVSGADDYIKKPFKISVLEQRLANQIATRKALRKRYSQELILKPKDIAITPSDELFLNNIQLILDEHLTDPDFNSETFCKLAKMSRMQLHRKLLAYTGLSTSAFIRSQRLKQALHILQTSDLTISEVAYTVGFSTPTYFMKCFKKIFKKTPSEYLQSVNNQ